MAKNIIDLYDCNFKLLPAYNGFMFKVNKFRVNLEEHDTEAENIFNDWIAIKFNEPIDVDRFKIYNVEDIYYDKESISLDIDGVIYRVIDADMFQTFVDTFDGDEDLCIENVMKYFITWFLDNLGML